MLEGLWSVEFFSDVGGFSAGVCERWRASSKNC